MAKSSKNGLNPAPAQAPSSPILEVELKFQVPAERRDAARHWVTGDKPAKPQHLQAFYFDTAGRKLAAAGLALRLRREDGAWFQTLKGGGSDGLTRHEHQVRLEAGPAEGEEFPALDPCRHRQEQIGASLIALLATQPSDALHCIFRTDIQRCRRHLQVSCGSVELVFDEGELLAGSTEQPQRAAVCELEIELLSGQPQAVLEVARQHALRLGLWLDGRKKNQLGDLLARGLTMAPARMAQATAIHAAMSVQQALQQVLCSCQEQILANASQIASGNHVAEHVHQLRVGLRRLRSGLRLFDRPELAAHAVRAQALAEGAANLFRQLGAARDSDMLAADWAPLLEAAFASAGVSAGEPAFAFVSPISEAVLPALLVRESPAQNFLLDLLGMIEALNDLPDPGAEPAPLDRLLRRRLRRWHARACVDAVGFALLDDEGRHRLRKRLKRLRYGIEFSAGLFDAERLRQGLKPLKQAQQLLGELNDLTLALQACQAQLTQGPQAWFALAWFSARRDLLKEQALPMLQAFAAAPVPWKG